MYIYECMYLLIYEYFIFLNFLEIYFKVIERIFKVIDKGKRLIKIFIYFSIILFFGFFFIWMVKYFIVVFLDIGMIFFNFRIFGFFSCF